MGLSIPEDLDAKIWRYEEADHLIDMLNNRALHFANAYKVWDRDEGLLPESIKSDYRLISRNVPAPHSTQFSVKQLKKSMCEYKRAIFLSCWHLDEDESVQRWNRYSRKNRNLKKIKDTAIQSTFMDLEKVNYDKFRRYTTSKVSYVNHRVADVPPQHEFTIFLQKRKKHAHECELRAIIFDPSQSGKKGIRIQIDLEKVVKRIVISPRAKDTLRDRIVAAVWQNHLHIPVEDSQFRRRTN